MLRELINEFAARLWPDFPEQAMPLPAMALPDEAISD